MATIQFDNGKKVKFDGNPTPQDIDFVAKQMGITPTATSTQPEPPKNGFLKDLAIGITKPVVRGLTGIAGAIQGTAGFLRNDPKQFEQGLKTMNEGVTLPGYGETRPIGNTGKGFGADVKDAVGVGAELGSYIPGAKLPQLAGQALKQTILQGAKAFAKEGAVMGGINSVGRELQSPESTLGSVAQQGLIGAGLGAGVGGILGGATAGIPSAIAARTAARTGRQEKALQQIFKAETKDLPMVRQAISSIDAEDINSYKALADRLDEKINLVSSKLDEASETNTTKKLLDNLSLKTTVGGQTLKNNYVEQGLNQLEDFYTKTNNLTEKAKIQQLRQKATTEGLSTKEINDIARQHSRDLNAFNANGELSSGLSKQAAENTRTGIKATFRDVFGNNVSKAADAELTSLIRARDFAKEMVEDVNDLERKIQSRGLGERAGRLMGEVVNIIGANGPKGFIEYFIGRGTGLKTLNAIEIQNNLAKNIKLIQKAAKEGASEKDIIQALEEFIKNSGGKVPLLLPEKAGKANPMPLYGTQKGVISPLLQEVGDVANVETGKIKPPTSAVPPKPFTDPLPYTPDSELPIISFGNKLKAKPSALPAIKLGAPLSKYPKALGGAPKTQKIQTLVTNAKKYDPSFKSQVEKVAKSLGLSFAHGPVKTEATIADKLIRDATTVENIKDANRSTLFVQSKDELNKIVDSVKKEFGNVTRVKDKFNQPGYKSAIINVKSPLGHDVEVAVTTPKMWEARMKLGGEKLYNITRSKLEGWEKAEQEMLNLYEQASN